jgi:AbiV family abortive infection protein
MDAVLENARRLLNDARLLFNNGRYPTATSLAVLSIEEFGKAIHGMSVGHLSKQMAAASFGKVNHIVDRLKDAGFEIKRVEELSEPQRSGSRTADFIEIVAEALKEALPNSEWQRLLEAITNKELLTIKNRGFYVDLDPDGKVLCMPSSIDGAAAARLIEVAASLLRAFEENWRLQWQ